MGLLTGLLHDALAPLLDEITKVVSRLVRTIVLYLLAGLCAFAALIALTVALDIWIASLIGPLRAALSMAGLYALVAIVCVAAARVGGRSRSSLRGSKTAAGSPVSVTSPPSPAGGGEDAAHPQTAAAIDMAIAPLLDILERKGLKRERIAVLTGALLAKRAGPLPLTGAAAVTGFAVGRFWKSLLDIAEKSAVALPVLSELLAQLSAQAGVPGPARTPDP